MAEQQTPLLPSAEGFAFKYKFKMYLEGILCPFQSVSVSSTPNGIEMNIEVHVTDKIFDLIPKTFVQVLYRDWYGSYQDWHLLGDGYFSGFAKYDDATGSRTVSMVCRDFRMDIRKAPSNMIFNSDENDLNMMGLHVLHGIKKTHALKGKDGVDKKVNGVNRVHGGRLNMFSWIIRLIAGSAAGEINKDDTFIDNNNGRYFLDAFCRGVWLESTQGTTYGIFSNSRLRIEKRLYIPENNSGYRMFTKDYLNDFGGQIISGGSMFSSVEAVMMRLAAIFQCQPYSCSTPTMSRIEDASSELVCKYMKGALRGSFGDPYVLNSCMILPPMHFTAPPNCNIIFPCMYSKISWQHDYDADLTRGSYKVANIFDDAGINVTNKIVPPEKQQREVPNSLLASAAGKDNPPLTIEERFKGVNIVYGDIEYMTAARSVNSDYADRVLKDPASFKSAISKLKNKAEYQALSDEIDFLALTNTQVDTEILQKKKDKVKEQLSKLATVAPIKPDIYDVMGRHAVFKFLMNRFMGRSINVSGDFNPYIVAGFPAIVMADDNRKEYKTLRTLIGFVQTVHHQVSAQGTASTTIIMTHVRFINEPTDIDDIGNPLYVGATNPADAKINKSTLQYLDLSYNGQSGYPIVAVENISSTSNIYDWKKKVNSHDPKDPMQRKLKYAKDILLVTAEGMKEGKSNLNFTDERYTPNKIPLFYQQIFGQPFADHFMVAFWSDPKRKDSSYFIYDSIHEAVENALMKDSRLMDDYNSAIEFVRRPVVTEEEYFLRILGASCKLKSNPETKTKPIDIYSNEWEKFKTFGKEDTDRWYGIPDEDHSQFTYPEGIRTFIKPGELSSVYEKRPVTPFLDEKRKQAEIYIQEVNSKVASTR